ncbi:MAG: 3-hydroxyacyl-CoA dehydrogenase family protein [Syntrophaceae bacterium]|nr:3-hydroxyacyl-CoA dehydrogenase family protein [Syntrophaceae bacterium]
MQNSGGKFNFSTGDRANSMPAPFADWKIAVVGAGTMGHGIALAFARHGLAASLTDQDPGQLKQAKRLIAAHLSLLAEMAEISADQIEQTQSRLAYCPSLEDAVRNADLVIEAVSETPDVKQSLYALLDNLCSGETLLASNTSALNIYEFLTVSRPERLIITHWFNPPHLMPLVEVVPGPRTAPQTVETIKALLSALGKTPAVLTRYVPGFIINRLAMAIMREASYMVDQGWTSPEDIDAAVIATFGPRYAFEGPLGLAENVGWDVIRSVLTFLAPRLKSDSEPSAFIDGLCAEGRLGVKAGRGIRDYGDRDIREIQNERNRKIIRMIRAVKNV